MTRSSSKRSTKRQRNQLQPPGDSGSIQTFARLEADENPMASHFALAIAKAPRKFQTKFGFVKGKSK